MFGFDVADDVDEDGFFVAVEFSLVRSRKTRLESMARNGDRLARIALRAIANMGRMLSASQLGITLSSLGLGALTEETLAEVFAEWLHSLPMATEIGLRVEVELAKVGMPPPGLLLPYARSGGMVSRR